MRISVIIPVYNDARRLQACLEALDRQTFPREMMEVIVVDNGSKEPPKSIVENYPFCRLETETKSGSYAARNRGLQVATGEIIAFTDADCLPDERWLEAGAALLDADPNCAIVGGAIHVFPAIPGHPTSAELYDIVFGLPQEEDVLRNGSCMTANLITRRTVFDQVGPFDETAFSGGDHMWSQRVVAAGGKVHFVPEAFVKHPARDSVKAIATKARRLTGGRHSRRAANRRSFLNLHSFKILFLSLFPNVRQMAHAWGNLRKEGYGISAWLRVCGIIIIVQYTKFFEFARLRLQGTPEKR